MELASEWFEKLYTENAPQMLKFAKRVLGDEELARDIVHDVFIVLLMKQPQVRTHESPRLWLYTTLRNRIGNELKRRAKKEEIPLEEFDRIGREDTVSESLADYLPAGLKDTDREILLMFFEEKLPHEEIAKRLRCSEASCRTRLHRAKERCKVLYLKEKKNLGEKCNILTPSGNI